ncbi:MAG: hypothetical protein KKE29_12965 [Proteobacteria bacterium]|nr:hypothetical protein [Pseudomonadota bacterium]MBU4573818.1 hypothetical protein [Pseudomonadota bacterium]MBU4599055.1 hypothetical protein [Pseudomonadota bacterium]MBV1714892.1 hypothetical protein [Desulfarculus sp.]MBV1752687.1 hypothetical protein [Desulfarculus sp.]
MASFLAGLAAVIGLGVIVAEMLNGFHLVSYQFTAWQGAGSLAALYLLGVLLRSRIVVESQNPVLAWLARCHVALVLLLGLALVATLPALWWGIIRKLATGAIKPG